MLPQVDNLWLAAALHTHYLWQLMGSAGA